MFVDNQIGIILIFIFILILVNGFFAAAEMALVALDRNKIEQHAQKGNKKASLVLKVTKDSTKYLSTIQVAITLAGFMSSALAGAKLSTGFVELIDRIGVSMTQTAAIIIVTFLLSFVTLIFGELVPKRIALAHANKFALFSIHVIYITMLITKPFVWLLSISTHGVLKVFGVPKQSVEEKVTEDDIKQLIVKGHTEGLYKSQEKQMLQNIFRFDDLTAEMIMIPRVSVYGVDISLPSDELIGKMIDSRFTRLVVYQKSIDDVVGIVHIKDILLEAQLVGFDKIDLRNIIRNPFFVHKNTKINVLFKKMQLTNEQFAILVDDYGGVEGIVTMEDLIEEVFGNIYDEHDIEDQRVIKVKENTYLVNGSMLILDLNRSLNTNIEIKHQAYETLRGFIHHQLGHLPKKNEKFDFSYKDVHYAIYSYKDHDIDQITISFKET